VGNGRFVEGKVYHFVRECVYHGMIDVCLSIEVSGVGVLLKGSRRVLEGYEYGGGVVCGHTKLQGPSRRND
jgi:hypothetical protein